MIKIDIDMPQSCEDCFAYYKITPNIATICKCGINGFTVDEYETDTIYSKPDWCPLIEVIEDER